MPNFYVYAPVSGQVGSCWTGPVTCLPNHAGCGNVNTINTDGRYCGSTYSCGPCCHPRVSCSEPQDIKTGISTPSIDFVADPVVGSIWVGLSTGVCGPSSNCSTIPYTRIVNIHMFSGSMGSGTSLGVVTFAHVDSPLTSSYYNTFIGPGTGHAYRTIGSVPSGTCGSCYTGPHVHWEHCGNSIINSGISCGDTMIRSLSWVFQYTY